MSDARAHSPHVPTPAGVGGCATMAVRPGLRARKDATPDCSSSATTFSPDGDLLLRRVEQKSLRQHRTDQRGVPVEPQPRHCHLGRMLMKNVWDMSKI